MKQGQASLETQEVSKGLALSEGMDLVKGVCLASLGNCLSIAGDTVVGVNDAFEEHIWDEWRSPL